MKLAVSVTDRNAPYGSATYVGTDCALPQSEQVSSGSDSPLSVTHAHRSCSTRGRNIKQVSRWLGHADPAFTLRTYVHLMDEGIGGADLLDSAVPMSGNGLAAKPPQPGDKQKPAAVEEIAI